MKLYSPLINKALKIAYNAHLGQFDKGGVPYIYHPVALAEHMDTEDEIIVALLHDVVEDSGLTFADLERAGFAMPVMAALKLLTHQDGSEYMDYISRIEANPLALKVKLADLRHNSDETRNAALSPVEAAHYRQKYAQALQRLSKLSGE